MQINGLFFLEFYEKDGISLQKGRFFEDDYLVFWGDNYLVFLKTIIIVRRSRSFERSEIRIQTSYGRVSEANEQIVRVVGEIRIKSISF